jgi:UDP-N-acetylglucosamine--N-acetylmuramyl-(pentapeptide) pyrophosphoryl-undecaprenol N-acetylglucosamine transferase
LLICAGGTGGGVYPALAVLERFNVEGSRFKVDNLQSSNLQPSTFQPSTVLWVGGEGGMEEELVNRAGISYRSIPAAGVHGVGLRTLPRNIAKLARGVSASRKILRDFKPDALFFTGGYVAAPMALAGRNIPSALFVPDIEPGLALKFLSFFADKITVTTSASLRYFSRPERISVTGYPLRSDLETWTRERANQRLELDSSLPTLLVTGGSKGARSINNAVLRRLPELLAMGQLIHIVGALDFDVAQEAAENMPEPLRSRYHPMPYLHEMGAALVAADLVVSRAGASTLGEYPLFGLPAILVPYPYAWRYQKVNADYLVENNAAVVLKDEDLQAELLSAVKKLLHDKDKLNSMRAAMKKLARPNAARAIASQLVELAGEPPL